jgi:hypothetical protein
MVRVLSPLARVAAEAEQVLEAIALSTGAPASGLARELLADAVVPPAPLLPPAFVLEGESPPVLPPEGLAVLETLRPPLLLCKLLAPPRASPEDEAPPAEVSDEAPALPAASATREPALAKLPPVPLEPVFPPTLVELLRTAVDPPAFGTVPFPAPELQDKPDATRWVASSKPRPWIFMP